MNFLNDATLFDKTDPGSSAFSKDPDYVLKGITEQDLPESLRRKEKIGLPELSELEVVRHYTSLSSKTFSVDMNFYPLGSCTMKYNPKVNETIASMPGFTGIHPLEEASAVQGCLKLLYQFEKSLCRICGMDSFTLQPAAGAHGELTALYTARKYFKNRKEARTKVVVPDSSHGTNPASAALAGFHLVTIPSKNGEVDLEALKKECTPDLAVFMLTNPNTVGLFEKQIESICAMVHEAGGLAYMDGANLNALLGLVRPGDIGFDMLHINLHKTFSTPHGGGGPGSGPVGVKSHLAPFLPVPFVTLKQDAYVLSSDRPLSIGSVKSFFGNFGVILKASAYLDAVGFSGLREISEAAIISANYLKSRLGHLFDIAFDKPCMHEFVMSPDTGKYKVKTLDIAKRLLDYGIHAPTIYFPLIVHESIMIEPTETESKQTLDQFVSVLEEIMKEAAENPEKIKNAPYTTYRVRMDEVEAARNPVLRWMPS